MQDQLIKTRHLISQRSIDIDTLLLRFIGFLSIKLPDRSKKFCLSSGRIKSIRMRPSMYLSVQNPFIKFLNHGSVLRNEAKFTKLVFKLKELHKFLAKGEIKGYINRVLDEVKARALSLSEG